jgi:hypothetical protein
MSEQSEFKPSLGFQAGLLIGSLMGIVLGATVGGIALIGQGLWNEGRYWGYQQCLEDSKYVP